MSETGNTGGIKQQHALIRTVQNTPFEAFVSMSGYLGLLTTDIEVAVANATMDAQHVVPKGLNASHVKKVRIAWIRLTESMSGTDQFV